MEPRTGALGNIGLCAWPTLPRQSEFGQPMAVTPTREPSARWVRFDNSQPARRPGRLGAVTGHPEQTHHRTFALGPVPALIAAAVLGGLAGVAAKLTDESGIGWLSDLGTFLAIWVLVIVVIGWKARTVGAAALRAAVFVVGLSLAYYAFSTFVLGFPGGALVQRWAILAVTAVPLMAAATWWASRRSGPLPAVVLGVIAAIAIADGNVLPFWYAVIGDPLPEEFPYRPIQAAVEIGTALVVAGLVPRDWATRAMALVLVFPALWLVPELISIAMRLVSV